METYQRLSDIALSCDGQRYVVTSEGIGLRVRQSQISANDAPMVPKNAKPVEIRHLLNLQCERCYSETTVALIVGHAHRCSICGQEFTWQQVDDAFAATVAYPFRRVRELAPDSGNKWLSGLFASSAHADSAHIFGDDFGEDLQQCEYLLGNTLTLEFSGQAEEDYYFLSRFMVARYGSCDTARFALKLLFFYKAYRALDYLGGGWPRAEVLRLGRELVKHISPGIPLQGEEGEDWAIANAIAGSILLMALTRIKEIYGDFDEADGGLKEELEFWSRMLIPVAFGQIAAQDKMYEPIRIVASTALVWSAYSGWIPDSEAGWVGNVCYNIVALGAFKNRDDHGGETQLFKPFAIPTSQEVDFDLLITALANGLLGHIKRRQLQTTFYLNLLFVRSFLHVPTFSESMLDSTDGRERDKGEEELTKSLFQRLGWLHEELSKEPTPWQLNKRTHWAVEAGRLAWATSNTYAIREMMGLVHTFLEGACIMDLREAFLMVPQDRRFLVIESTCATLDALCVKYANSGWTAEALCLMAFCRGWTINARAHERRTGANAPDDLRRNWNEAEEVTRLFNWQSSIMLAKLTGVPQEVSAPLIGSRNYGSILKSFLGKSQNKQSELVTFSEDFDDDRVYQALRERLKASSKRTLIVSITWTESPFDRQQLLAVAILCWGGAGMEQRMDQVLWNIPKATLADLEVLSKISPGAFREKRLLRLTAEASDRLIKPFIAKLPDSEFDELAVCGPGTFAVLPLESALIHAGFPLLAITTLPSLIPISDAQQTGCETFRKITIMAFQGESLAGAKSEMERITRLPDTKVAQINCFDMTADEILEAFESDANIIHCCAHGRYIEDNPDASTLIFGDYLPPGRGVVSAAAVAYDVRLSPGTLVVLSACCSALVPNDRSNSWRGLAGAFLRAGATGVIAARWAVSDRAAASFFSVFYDSLALARRPQMALLDAKAALRAQGAPLEEWDCFGYFGGL